MSDIELFNEETLTTTLVDVYEKLKNTKGGKVASYIPELKKANPNWYGIAICTVKGHMYAIGDADIEVAIESVSKVFTLALAIKKHGTSDVRKKIGSTSSPLAFNSINAANKSETHTLNPFVNAGAMATTSLVATKKDSKREIIKKLFDNMSAFAGKKLRLSESVYKSESMTNFHNKSLAYLLKSYNRFYNDDVDKIVDAYTAQCSALVSAVDLSVMGAVLANGGVNPITHKKIIDEKDVDYVTREMACNGLYERSEKWFKEVGIPMKSGVSGTILMVIPGVMGIGIVSPPLSEYGNSVKGLKTAKMLSDKLGLSKYFSLQKACKKLMIKSNCK